jgi:hypothetical protein
VSVFDAVQISKLNAGCPSGGPTEYPSTLLSHINTRGTGFNYSTTIRTRHRTTSLYFDDSLLKIEHFTAVAISAPQQINSHINLNCRPLCDLYDLQITNVTLKVPKCENFHRTDFFYFFTIKPLWVGDFRAKIKNSKF